MKTSRFLVGLVAVAIGIGLAVALAPRSPAERACEGLAKACGPHVDVAGCESDLEDATEAELRDVVACVEPAENCIEVTACLSGAVLRDVGQGLMRGLFQTR